LLRPASDAQQLIREFPFRINCLHEDDSVMTVVFPISASNGAAVDVRARTGLGFADG
jgi:hypothetical protein